MKQQAPLYNRWRQLNQWCQEHLISVVTFALAVGIVGHYVLTSAGNALA